MSIYLLSGPDPTSDNGYWEMIVEARTRCNAMAAVQQTLKDKNRPDLLDKISIQILPRRTGGHASIIHSTLQ